MKLSEIAVQRPITTIMFFAAIVLLGLVSVVQLPMQILPNISPPYGAVRCFLRQTMSVEELERKVIKPIEGEIAQLPNVKSFHAHSWGSRGAFFFIQFEFGTNVKYKIVDLQDRLEQFRRKNFERRSIEIFSFPFDTDWANKSLMDLVLKGPRSDPYLEGFNTDRLQQKLQDIDGVASADIWGGKRRSVDVTIFQDRLREFGVPMWRVINRIRTFANEPVFLGDIEDKNNRYYVRLDGQFGDTSEIEDVVVKDGGNIAVRHLGEAKDVFRSRRWLRRVDGQPALGIELAKEALVNPIELSSRARKVIEEINEKDLPEGYQLDIVWDAADEIRYFLKTLSKLALMGVVLSMIILYMFIRNVRMALIVCLVIPICIVATFNAMYFSEMSINIISLLGLAVGVGCLIDSSIVVLENIFRHHEHGREAIYSAKIGSREVGMAVFALTLTNVLVFLPIVFIEGEIRLVFTEGALAIVYPMAISMLVALTLVPMATSRILYMLDKRKKFVTAAQGVSNRVLPQTSRPPFLQRIAPPPLMRFLRRIPLPNMAASKNYYGVILKSCLRHRVRFLIGIVLVILYTYYYTMTGIGRDVMEAPQDDEWFEIYVYLPNGTNQTYTLNVVSRVEDMLKEQVPEAKNTHSWVRDDSARINVHLKPAVERKRESATIKEELRPYMEQFTEAEVTFNYTRARGENEAPPVDTGRGGLIEIRGPEYNQIDAISENLAEVLGQVPGVRDVASENEPGPLEAQFRMDRDAAALLQITPQLVAQSIQVSQRRSDYAQIQMKKGDDEIDIIFTQIENLAELDKAKKEDSEMEGITFEELRQVPIFSPSLNSTVTLEELGRLDIRRGMANIAREDRERIGRIRFQTAANSNYGDIEASVKEVLSAYPAPAGYRITLGGKTRTWDEGIKAIKTIVYLAILLIYMCIAALFESFSQPLVIMGAIPLSIIGIVWALLLTNTPFTELAGLGCIFLIGLLPNSAILLVHFAGHLRREKDYTRERAIMMSGYTRLRPIFMTVLTTILGLLPMAFSWRGDEEWVPFAITVIGGLASSTILTLIIVPGFYFIIEDLANLFSRCAQYMTSFRWLFIFWSRKRRAEKRQELTAYRIKPPREEPLLIDIDHLTRIYPPSRLESWGKSLKRVFRSAAVSPVQGFIPQPAAPETVSTRARKKALDMVSLDIQPGLFGLLGPNGAGKTTLLRLIAGIDQATRGYLSICGYDMKSEAKKAQKLIGYLPQHFGVYSHMTAYQYLEYFALLKGMKRKKERREAIMRALEMVNLADQEKAPVGQFSGGMMRRIGLAQIFVSPPKVLIVDEPTAGLDPLERVRLRNLLAQLAKDRIVILSTHIVEDVAHSCRQMALVDEGKILYQGSPDDLVATARGKVWEYSVFENQDEWRRIRSHYVVAGQSHTADGIRMRIISNDPPGSSAVSLEPNLEDAYLYHIHVKDKRH